MTKKVYGRKETDPERLRLLEAVAEAMRVILDAAYGPEWDNERLWEVMAEGRAALAALEAYNDRARTARV